MNENQNPQEITDDVEGHATRGKGLHADDEDGESTEGHGALSGRFRPDEDAMFGDDTEGHVTRGRG